MTVREFQTDIINFRYNLECLESLYNEAIAWLAFYNMERAMIFDDQSIRS